MIEALLNIPSQSAMYLMALAMLLLLLTECCFRFKELRWGIAGIVYLTVGLWYFIDPIYRVEDYQPYADEMGTVFVQVLIFLLMFRIGVEVLAARTPSRVLRAFDPRLVDKDSLIQVVLLLWMVLFMIGMYRADFRFIDALFPTGARWSGAQMWNRGRLGGAIDFLVSIGFYSYLMTCACFGLVSVGTKRTSLRLGMMFMMCLTWPMFALSGSRSMFLAVAMPTVLAILILKRWSRGQQLLFVVLSLAVINVLMLISIASRGQGVANFFASDTYGETLAETKHAGLNMPEELVYINRYQDQDLLTPEWGWEYFAQAVNFVPRFMWPGKPFPGEKFAALRIGYYQGQVAATISNGLIGQGVQNFGKWIGPIAPAILLSLLTSLLCRLPNKGNAFLRTCVVIFLIGLIPNLGRDLSLMTLWPAIFAMAGVAFYENIFGTGRRRIQHGNMPHLTNTIAANPENQLPSTPNWHKPE